MDGDKRYLASSHTASGSLGHGEIQQISQGGPVLRSSGNRNPQEWVGQAYRIVTALLPIREFLRPGHALSTRDALKKGLANSCAKLGRECARRAFRYGISCPRFQPRCPTRPHPLIRIRVPTPHVQRTACPIAAVGPLDGFVAFVRLPGKHCRRELTPVVGPRIISGACLVRGLGTTKASSRCWSPGTSFLPMWA